jgi:hypothetical protein
MSKSEEKPTVETSEKHAPLDVVWVLIESLKPNWYNPNRQSEYEFELLCKSMKEDGFDQPILVLRKDNMIVDGEHRWRAAQVLGMKEVPVVYTDMTPEQMMVSTLRHNRARGSEDSELVNRVLKDLKELGAEEIAKDSLMISDAEMDLAFMQASSGLENAPTVGDLIKEGEAVKEDGKGLDEEYTPSIGQGVRVFVTKDAKGNEVASSLSKEAADLMRRKEKEVKAKWQAEEDGARQKDGQLLSYVFLYTEEEARIVKAVLGQEPATKVLELCRRTQEQSSGKEGSV